MGSNAPRKPLPAEIEAQVLVLSRRRCCLCFGLLGDFSVRKGQIAHLDHDPTNNDPQNLAFLCFEHHDEYDTVSRQSKGLKHKEVLIHRESLYVAVHQFLDPVAARQEPDQPLMASEGELDYYLAASASIQSDGLLVLNRIRAGNRDLIDGLNAANEDAVAEISQGKASTGGQKRYSLRLATALGSFARLLSRETEELSITTSKLLSSLSRAAAVASDLEAATPPIFQQKLEELNRYYDTLSETANGATRTSEAVRRVRRGPVELNKARRLAFAAFEGFAQMASRQMCEIQQHQDHLRKVISLL